MANDIFQQRENLLKKQFAEARRGLEGEKQRALQKSEQDINRFAAANMMQGSGRLLKSKQKQEAEISQRLGEVESGISQQEAAAQQAIAQEKGQQEFARSERLGSQDFAAAEAEKGRALAREQFAEATRQWNLEFNENLNTNMINAAIALQDAGLGNPKAWRNLLGDGGVIGGIYGTSRIPTINTALGVKQSQPNAPQQVAPGNATGGRPGFYRP